MPVIRIIVLSLLLWTIALEHLSAQQLFDSGSDGSYGPINVTTGTVTLTTPEDGIFRATTVNVAAGATLGFTRNAHNTPVYVLATGDIAIAGTVRVNGGNGGTLVGGAGGPGGFDGGGPGLGRPRPSAGYGPGAGLGGASNSPFCNSLDTPGAAAYSTVSSHASSNDGKTYGSPLLVPLVGGSGGGGAPWGGGGGGGGAIILASNTKVHITGTVQALGALGSPTPSGFRCNNGSGGGIRIIAPVVSGPGTVNVTGGSSHEIAGSGRVRIDFIDASQATLTISPNNGVLSTGAFLAVFPPTVPRLDIVSVAGQAIPVDIGGLVQVLLPIDVPSRQTVVVQASHFSGIVPIEVVLTPDTGDPLVYPASIDTSLGNPAQVAVPVDIPGNVTVRVAAWTRFQ